MGVKPFEATNRAIFYGRDEDIDSLYNLILCEKLTVLFGKSGYGKSSLLNAGVLPLFRKEMNEDNEDKAKYYATVIEVRLGSYIEGKTLSPTDAVQAKLDEKLPFNRANNKYTEGGDCLDNFYPNESNRPLWYHFKRQQNNAENGRFILIFDQFEEFFTYPAALQERFKRELSELLYSDIPQYLRRRLNELTPNEKKQLTQTMDIKAVFGIRADRISFLDSMKDTLPAILHKRYELRPLTQKQAIEAITIPSGLTQKKLIEKGVKNIDFITPPFEYTKEALEIIISKLLSDRNGIHLAGIEAFQLQILCQYIESHIESGDIRDIDGNCLPDVTPQNLPDTSNLYETYYRRQLNRLDPSVRRAAQVVLEDGLLAENTQTGGGRRMSVDSVSLKNQFNVTDTLLRELENTYLVRKEPNSVDGESLEISHDTLIEPILKMKKERHAKEELEEARCKQEEAQKRAAIEKRRRQIATLLSIAAVFGFMLSAIVGFWALKKKNEAMDAKDKADISKEEAIRSELATQIALNKADSMKFVALHNDTLAQIAKNEAIEAAQVAKGARILADKKTEEARANLTAKIQSDIDKYIVSADRMIELGKHTLAREILTEALKLDATNSDILTKFKEIENK